MAGNRLRRLRVARWARRFRPARRLRGGPGRRMERFGVPRYRYLLLLPALLALIALAAYFRVPKAEATRYQPAQKAIVNPLSGLAIDARTDPAGVSGEYSLVYAVATWRELEPEEGEYAFEAFDRAIHLTEWRARGAKLIFRLSLDSPGEAGHADIPEWLLEATGDGEFYAADGGAGYAPDYSNPLLRIAHGKLLEAIARRYEDGGALAYVEMGSLGAFGLWETDRQGGAPALPMTDIASLYIWQYAMAFSETPVLARRPYREAMLLGYGAYNPDLGDADAAWSWLDLFAFGGWDDQIDTETRPQTDFGLAAPSGAWLGADFVWEDDIGEALRMAEECRATYVCGDFEGERAARALAGAVGYRYWVRQADWPGRVRRDYSLYVDLIVRNDGYAPLSRGWPVEIALLRDGEAVYAEIVDADPSEWLPGDSRARVRITVPADMEPGDYSLAIAILDPDTGTPAVRWAMEGEGDGLLATLGAVRVY